MKPPPTDCVTSTRVAGPCACGQPLAPAHLGVSVARVTCGACCTVCVCRTLVEPLGDGPVQGTAGVQESLWR